MKAEGIITAISDKGDRYAIQLDKKDWYNGWGQTQSKKGDKISIKYGTNNGFKNITKVETIENTQNTENTDRQTGIAESARLRRKTDCLKMSVEIAIASKEKVTQEEMKKVAQEFFDWVENNEVKTSEFKVPVTKTMQG